MCAADLGHLHSIQKEKVIFIFFFSPLIACQVSGRGVGKRKTPDERRDLFYHRRKNPSAIITSQTIRTLCYFVTSESCCTSWTNGCYIGTSINPEWKNCPNRWWMALSRFPIELCCETMMHIGKSPCVPFSSYAYPILDSFHSLWHPLQTNVNYASEMKVKMHMLNPKWKQKSVIYT